MFEALFKKRIVIFLFKLSISILGLVIALKISEFGPGPFFKNLEVKYLFTALISLLVSYLFSAFRTTVVFKIFEQKLSFKRSIFSYFIGNWFNQFLPSNIGGDVVRAHYVRDEISLARSLFYLFVDRLVGLVVSMLIVALFFAAFLSFKLFLLCLLLILFFLLFPIFLQNNFFWVTEKLFSQKKKIEPRNLFIIIITSTVAHFFNIICYYFIGKSFNLDIKIEALFLLVPVISYISLIPISLGGWGVRETSTVLLFRYYQVSEGMAFSLSVTYGLLVFLAAIPGLIFFISVKRKNFASSVIR